MNQLKNREQDLKITEQKCFTKDKKLRMIL